MNQELKRHRMIAIPKVPEAFAALSLAAIFVSLPLLVSIGSSQGAPDFQSVSGEFARNWIAEFKKANEAMDPDNSVDPVDKAGRSEANGSSENENDLWSWGGAPKGSEIVDGELVIDPNYLRPFWNLSSNWLDESYTDSDSGLPVDTYIDPKTGRKYYRYLNPSTGESFFSYYTYQDDSTGQTIYVYVDPVTGEEVHSVSKPFEVINALASGLYQRGY
ncbi:MAG: hypothetical protein HPY61_13945 [Methanotrichaceae archaeon]|nr:hypothetical protein [Methanotrichaceae archaeon]